MKMLALMFFSAAVSLPVTAATPDEVVDHYADLAYAKYGDALTSARSMQTAIETLLSEPSERNLAAARQAWVDARHPYQQTEVYRFGNAIVDDWEGKVNAWPLDEGLIDYVAASYGGESDENPFYTANVIANPVLQIGGIEIDAREITPALLAETLHEVDEIEANVATGYHAIEFLLWGQDLNGTGPGAGQRPASDFDPQNCSWGNCDRRAAYLRAATDLLIQDLEWIVAQWDEGGTARSALREGDLAASLATVFTGMGSLSYGELAGERMKLGLMLHDPEEEHDCFSDNTHWSHYNNVLGIWNIYTGSYTRLDGSKMTGPSVSDLVAARDPDIDAELRSRLHASLAKMQVLVDSAQAGEAYDQMIGAGNAEGNARIQAAVDALVDQTRSIERAIGVLGLESVAFEGSDSLDAPEKVFN
jgi:putative iron-regulated protein